MVGKRINGIIVLLVVLTFLSAQASAFGFQDILDWFSGLFGSGSEKTGVCNPPYMKLGDKCCLDRDNNRICDKDEGPATTRTAPTSTIVGGAQAVNTAPTTASGAQTTGVSQTTTLRGQTTAQATTTTLKTNLHYKTVDLSAKLVADVDPVLTQNNQIALVPTRQDDKKSFLDIVDISSGVITSSVPLSAGVLSGLDVVAIESSKLALIPTKAGPLTGFLDIISISSGAKKASVELAAEPMIDVDIQITPNGQMAIMPTRQDSTNSFVEMVDISSGKIIKKLNLQGDFVRGVDLLVSNDGRYAYMPTLKPTLGSNIHFIDVSKQSLLKVLGVDGAIEEDIDVKITKNDEIMILPTRTPVRGFLTIIEAKTITIQKKIELSGTLKEQVDAYIMPDQRSAFIPVYKGSQGMVDFIDLYTKQKTSTVTLSGNLVTGVDGKVLSDGKTLLMPSQMGTTGWVDVIDVATGTKRSVKMSGELMEAVDIQVSDDEQTAYMPFRNPGRAKIAVIDLKAAQVAKVIDLRADLVKDLDALITYGARYVVCPSSLFTGHLDIITNTPAKSLTVLQTGMGMGWANVIDIDTDSVFGVMNLKGNTVAGVDAASDSEGKMTPHFDEDMVREDEDQKYTTTSTTFPGQSTTTSSTIWDPTITYTTTTLSDWPTTTTLEDMPTTTTTVDDRVITPRCGDGYLSWSGSSGGGSEECDLNDNPTYRSASGAVINCPAGLTCKNCKCEGCGDGRIQAGEACEPNNKHSLIGSTYLWTGQKTECGGQYEYCSAACKCESSINCEASGLSSKSDCGGMCSSVCEKCVRHPEVPCYMCESDCSKLGQGWGKNRDICPGCNDGHSECVRSEDCSDCYRCEVKCPENMGFYRFDGCDAKCDNRLCKKVGTGDYKDCYQCNEPVCGDGIISPPGEQCEKTSDCPDYHTCSGCKCVTDCGGYCGSVGNGFTNNAGVANSGDCATQGDPNSVLGAKIAGLNEQCYAVCGKAYFLSGLSNTCCCVKTNKVHCLDCPGQNPDCNTAMATCRASIPM